MPKHFLPIFAYINLTYIFSHILADVFCFIAIVLSNFFCGVDIGTTFYVSDFCQQMTIFVKTCSCAPTNLIHNRRADLHFTSLYFTDVYC